MGEMHQALPQAPTPLTPLEAVLHYSKNHWSMSASGSKREAPVFRIMSASPSCGHNAANAYAAWCRCCCKSPRWPDADFPAVEKFDRRPLIRVPSIALPRSSASLSSDDEVPRIFTRKSRLKPGKFLITSAKRLLQQNLPLGDLSRCSNVCGQDATQSPRQRVRATWPAHLG
jgi:hypothetical protein